MCLLVSIKLAEWLYKPGSVPLSENSGDSHSSRPAVTHRLKQPTRKQRGSRLMLPYLVLLQMGFTSAPTRYRVGRCALTAPFHPYQINLAVYSL